VIDIEIKAITDPEEARKVEAVQQNTWGMPEAEVIPARLLHALQFTGSCLLGAYDGTKLVGFIFGVLGTVEDLKNRIDQVAAARLQMYSVTMGVLPEYQQQGIGFKLKMAQREFSLRIGVRLVTWTYDPLESRNGYFNIRKLGAISHKYLVDFHGQMSGINQGLPSDRFYVEWWVTSNRVQTRVDSSRGPLSLEAYTGSGAPIINEVSREISGIPQPPPSFIRAEDRLILIEIPENFQKIKELDMEMAYSWRMHIREIADYYFTNSYLVTDFIRNQIDGSAYHSYYVLTKSEHWNIGPRA
jgi:predicted GNAT superfamily acetyltransferase